MLHYWASKYQCLKLFCFPQYSYSACGLLLWQCDWSVFINPAWLAISEVSQMLRNEMGWKEGSEKSVHGYLKKLGFVLFSHSFCGAWIIVWFWEKPRPCSVPEAMDMPRFDLWKRADVLSRDMHWSIKSLGSVLWLAHVGKRAWLKSPGFTTHTHWATVELWSQ